MSFWRTFGFHTVSVVETILDREVFMLEELLDEEEILQEVKSQNKKLIDYLALPTTLQRLFEFITQLPSAPPPNNNNASQSESEDEALLQGVDQKRKFKYPFIACEILCSDIWAITEAIFHDDTLLDVLYSFLDNAPPLDTLLASYTSRVAGVLLGRRTVECLAYLRRRDGVIPSFLMHLSNASIMELLLKIIGCEESPEGVGTLEWLCSTDLIPILVQKMSKDNPVTVHENAGQTLVDILAVSANISQSPLVAQLESPEHLNQLYHHILTPDNSSALLHGLTVIIELLKRHYKEHPDESSATPLSGLPALLTVSIPHFHSLHQLLKTNTLSNEETAVMYTTTGPLSPPLGFYRLKIIEFFLAIMRTRYDVIDSAIQSEAIVLTIVELFFKYPWNNFLHIATEQIVQTVLECQKNDIKLDLLIQAGLLDRIIETNRQHLSEVNLPGGARRGYMGFLTNISLAISAVSTGNPELEGAIEKHEGWREYVATSLAEIRTIENKPLGGHRPSAFPTGESSGEDEEEQQDTDSIFDRYTKGFSDFPEDGGEEGFEEFDEQNMAYDNNGMFINHHTGGLSNARAFEWTENDNEDGGHVRSGSDSDEEQDPEDLVWNERHIQDEKHGGEYDEDGGEDDEHEHEHDHEHDNEHEHEHEQEQEQEQGHEHQKGHEHSEDQNHTQNGEHNWKQHATTDTYEYDNNNTNNNTTNPENNGILLDNFAQSGVSS
eukprot:TRINITY_DN7305_c0_g1_i3.p1 TRINITY_DN7305_c0_g1~~TRINITY_DN7305_c0_g1_i3.p1  ORF type:complete len:721 (+),score=138.35 TRINITY_DN7305_c0_g1_i3:227-2389(+)